MADNPYRVPLDQFYRTVNFSGGRSSAYMLYHMLDAHDGALPNSVAVVFANTGRELPETLDFVHACETRWNLPITWLEYDYRDHAAGGTKNPKNVHRVVDYHTASRDGEPFRTLNMKMRMLPNVVMRKCTSELKVETINRFCVRDLGWPRKTTKRVLGIRHDEPRRWRKALYEECDLEYPMVHAQVSKPMVDVFWAEQPFNLGIESWEGNCDGCFLVGQTKLMQRFRKRPWVADWWIKEEERHLKMKREDPRTTLEDFVHAQFSKRYTYRELRDRALAQRELPLGGDDEEALDCFCGVD